MLRNLSFKNLCSYVFISSTKYCRTIKKYAQDYELIYEATMKIFERLERKHTEYQTFQGF